MSWNSLRTRRAGAILGLFACLAFPGMPSVGGEPPHALRMEEVEIRGTGDRTGLPRLPAPILGTTEDPLPLELFREDLAGGHPDSAGEEAGRRPGGDDD